MSNMTQSSMSAMTPTVFNLIKSLMLERGLDESAKHDFIIACGCHPAKYENNSSAKIICITLTNCSTKKAYCVGHPTLVKYNLQYVKLTNNYSRRLGVRRTDFTVCGNTTELEHNGNCFFKYSFETLNRKNDQIVKTLKAEYDIRDTPEPFNGVQLEITMPDDES